MPKALVASTIFILALSSLILMRCRIKPLHVVSYRDAESIVVKLIYNETTATGWPIGPHYIVTANHFADEVKDGDRVAILHPHGVDTLTGTIAKRGDNDTDLALVAVEGELKPPYMAVSRRQIRVGDPIWVIGFGDRSTHPTMVHGIISSSFVDDWAALPRLTTDAQVQHGHSGSPILNSDGQVVGVVVSVVANPGILTQAIPADTIQNFIEDLR